MNVDVTNAQLDSYKAVVEAAKREIIAALPKPEPRGWKLLVIALPIILTSALGFFVFTLQSRVTGELNKTSQFLQTRLSLTQDYYKERLARYLAIHDAVVGMKEKVQQALNEPGPSPDVEDSVKAFSHSYATNSLFVTQDLQTSLDDLWRTSADSATKPPISSQEVSEILANVRAVEELMRRDLLIEELALDQERVHTTVAPQTGEAK